MVFVFGLCVNMKYCKECEVLKNDCDFPKHRFGYSSTCKDCTSKIKEKLKVESFAKGKGKVYTTRRKSHGEALLKPEGSIHKRCPSCRAHVYVVQTDSFLRCWKCGTDFKIVKALRDSTLHRGGIILRELA